MVGPKPPRSTLGYLGDYGAVPVNGRALQDVDLRQVLKFGEGQKTGEGSALVLRRVAAGEYRVEASGVHVGEIKEDRLRAADKRWVVTVIVNHYLAAVDFPLEARTLKKAEELLRKFW